EGIRTGVIKHADHTFEIDHKGKDSYELRKAGARQRLIGSDKRWALMVEMNEGEKSDLDNMIEHLDKRSLDLILVEGFKPEQIPKIEIIRPALGKPPLYPDDPDIIAIATDAELPDKTSLPILDLNSPEDVSEFIIRHVMHDDHSRVAGNSKN
ncbi:MAG TPA: molybdopterin-guanine dinucleotide biosynthesis protein B, partial [Gammaproteobacteria bacterium]|nr:molybdopterin-guanine dinucleotide biosynthesis protein B [Gammaproteobacteria bacterium]